MLALRVKMIATFLLFYLKHLYILAFYKVPVSLRYNASFSSNMEFCLHARLLWQQLYLGR